MAIEVELSDYSTDNDEPGTALAGLSEIADTSTGFLLGLTAGVFVLSGLIGFGAGYASRKAFYCE